MYVQKAFEIGCDAVASKPINTGQLAVERDNILKELANLLKKTCRNFDVVSETGERSFP
ncbi:hypothetical protein [Petroclostridium sp. X23]|uniref:hypothetical protein n=1 Tax=Petroclostridium sp. X23 TaxID=3045146 RepID=UPI0024ADB823|nr:hypothetical protein [Petroclostridium sp. X23]WHH61380.1 hypothetical protein QKW49_12030 [Petroclostridium sp. X23]